MKYKSFVILLTLVVAREKKKKCGSYFGADIAILMDASDSLTIRDFNKQKQMTASLLKWIPNIGLLLKSMLTSCIDQMSKTTPHDLK